MQLACASGQHIKEATLVVRKAGGDQQEYLKIKINDILISSYQVGLSVTGDIHPSEQVSFNFSKIQNDYRPQKADGTLDAAVTFSWDVKANAKA